MLQTCGRIISAQLQILLAPLTTEFRSELFNHCLRTERIVRIITNNKTVGNDGIPSEVYKLASEQLLFMMSLFLSGCMPTGKLQSTLMQMVIIPALKCKQANFNCHGYLQGSRTGPDVTN